MRYLTSADNELRFQRLIGNLPARLSAWERPQLKVQVLKPFAEQFAANVITPNLVESERIRIEVQLVAERMVRGQLTMDEAVAQMNGRTDELLAKRRALVEAGRIA